MIFRGARGKIFLMPSKFQDLVDASRQEKAEAISRLNRFKGFFRRLSGKGITAPVPSAFEFLSDEELRKFTESPVVEEQRRTR